MNHGLVISLVLLELVMLEKSWGFFSYLSSHEYGKILELQMLLFLSYLDHSIRAQLWTVKSKIYGAVIQPGVSVMCDEPFIVKLCLTVMLQDQASN